MDEENTQRVLLCCEKIGHCFIDKPKCLEALNASGHSFNYRNALIENNDRLVVVGTQVMNQTLASGWYYTEASMEAWAECQKGADHDEILSRLASEKQIDKLLILSPDVHEVSVKMRADAIRALVGAVFLDEGGRATVLVTQKLGIWYGAW